MNIASIVVIELHFPTTAGQIGKLIGAEILGDENAPVHRLSSLTAAESGALAFLADGKFQKFLLKLKESVVITSPELADKSLPVTYLLISEPKKAFARVAKHFVPPHPFLGVSTRAVVAPSAKIADGVSIGPGAVIAEGAEIGKGTVIYPQAFIGAGVKVGEACEIHPGVVLLTHVRIGNRVKIFSGAVLGSEGFGFLEGDSGYIEMPQLGEVIVGDDVRIGAKCTVDRGTLGQTRIGAGTKIDDQVHVGHNVLIGKNCILCAQVGISGSAVIEDGVILAGQVGVGGHLTIGAKAICGGQTGVATDIEGGKTYFLTPAVEIGHAMRIIRQQRRLPEIAARIRKLEEQNNDRG